MKAYNIRIRNNEFFPRSNIYTDSPQKKKKKNSNIFQTNGWFDFYNTRGYLWPRT